MNVDLEKSMPPRLLSREAGVFPIRSYVRRQGRMVPAQKRALDELWQYYGISKEGDLDLAALFGRQAPRHLEIGFGMGDALLKMACDHPENDYLGVEVHPPGVGQLLLGVRKKKISNVRIADQDAMEVLDRLADRSLDRVYLFFPDPWLKKRHHKRRLVRAAFVEKLRRVLAPGAIFHAATDRDDYARHIITVMEADSGFSNQAGAGRFHPRPEERPLTKFEKRGLRLGHEVRDLIFERR